MLEIEKYGGEGGILLPLFLASAGESYTSVIISSICAGYKRGSTSGPVSVVSVIRYISEKNGITGISGSRTYRERQKKSLETGVHTLQKCETGHPG